MSNEIFLPQKVHILKDDAQIKGYIHPTRITLLEILSSEKRTISSVAKELGVHPANITHHFKLLEKTGLIRLVEKRDTGKNLEKYYRAIAYTFEVASNSSNKSAIALSILKNDLSAAINNLKKSDPKKSIAFLATARISADRFDHFAINLENLINEFKKADSKGGEAYTINLSLYPFEIEHPDHLSSKEVRIS
jgi:DNA-binding transcriptional ArsR family regulator